MFMQIPETRYPYHNQVIPRLGGDGRLTNIMVLNLVGRCGKNRILPFFLFLWFFGRGEGKEHV